MRRRGTIRGIEEPAHQFEDERHRHVGLESIRVHGVPPEQAVADQAEGRRDGGDIERGRDAPFRLEPAEQALEAFGNFAVDAREDCPDAFVARGFEPDLDA